MNKQQANAEIASILRAAEAAFEKELRKAQAIADEHCIVFSIGEYGVDHRYYIPNFKGSEEILLNELENNGLGYWYGSGAQEDSKGDWVSSSELC